MWELNKGSGGLGAMNLEIFKFDQDCRNNLDQSNWANQTLSRLLGQKILIKQNKMVLVRWFSADEENKVEVNKRK